MAQEGKYMSPGQYILLEYHFELCREASFPQLPVAWQQQCTLPIISMLVH